MQPLVAALLEHGIACITCRYAPAVDEGLTVPLAAGCRWIECACGCATGTWAWSGPWTPASG